MAAESNGERSTERATGRGARRQRHIATIDYAAIYAAAFPSHHEARIFVAQMQAAKPADIKVAMHQAARMVWLADIMDEVACGRPALQVLFYLIAAEAVAKLARGFEGEGRSKDHVHIFFEEICGPEQQNRLSSAFHQRDLRRKLTVREVADLLYAVRCDVAHRGHYYDFHLPRHPWDGATMRAVKPKAAAGPPLFKTTDGRPIPDTIFMSLRAHHLRAIILEGAVLACKAMLEGSPD